MTQSLVDFSSDPAVLSFGDRDYAISPLTTGDFAACQRWMRDQRFDQLMKGLRHVPMESETIGIALAKISEQHISLLDMISQADAEVYLLYLSMKRGAAERGDPAVTYKLVSETMPAMQRSTFIKILHLITGLSDPDPLDVPKNHTTPGCESSTKTNGEKPSLRCAAITG